MENLGLKSYKFQCIVEEERQGILRVFESNNIPFRVKRVFTIVNAGSGSQRGQHAHKECNQLLCCVSGAVELICDDGNKQVELFLKPDSDGILVPSGIWAEQKYLKNNSVIIVFCDQPYDEDDYIRNYQEFLDWKKKQK